MLRRGAGPLLVAAALLALPGVGAAAELSGVTLAERTELAGERLRLNGMGLREKLFFDIYVVGLYLPTRARDADAVLGMDGPKRLVLELVYDELDRDRLVDAWQDGFEDNLKPDELRALADKIKAFKGLMKPVAQGDQLVIDYIPGTGTRVRLNGQTLGNIPGPAFARAWLAVFVGHSPPDRQVKTGLLGG